MFFLSVRCSVIKHKPKFTFRVAANNRKDSHRVMWYWFRNKLCFGSWENFSLNEVKKIAYMFSRSWLLLELILYWNSLVSIVRHLIMAQRVKILWIIFKQIWWCVHSSWVQITRRLTIRLTIIINIVSLQII